MHGSSSALKMELSRVSHFTILYRTLQPNCRTLSLDLARHGCHHRRQQDSRDGTWRGAGFPQFPQWPFNGALMALNGRYLRYIRG